MSSKQISPLLQTWYKWKALRLPWRKRFLVGLDLKGNTYWEFRDARGDDVPGVAGTRWRRIVHYPRSTHYGDVEIPPQWHQWLRHLRDAPPTLQEQHAEVRRQHRIRLLAAEADARWEAKPRVMDAPASPAAGTATGALGSGMTTGQPPSAPAPASAPSAALEGRSAGGGGNLEAGVGAAPVEETRNDAAASGEEEAARQDKTARRQADPWKQHRRTGPSEDWQPQAWTPPASKR